VELVLDGLKLRLEVVEGLLEFRTNSSFLSSRDQLQLVSYLERSEDMCAFECLLLRRASLYPCTLKLSCHLRGSVCCTFILCN
jgi:hypothetical protein